MGSRYGVLCRSNQVAPLVSCTLRKEEALLDRFALPDNFQPVIAVAFGYEQADPISRRKSLVSYKCNKASKEEDYNAMH